MTQQSVRRFPRQSAWLLSIVTLTVLAASALAGAHPGRAAGDTVTGQLPDRSTSAQLDDPSFYPTRGFWDIKGVTRFINAPDQAAALASMGIGRIDTSWAAFEPQRLTLPCPTGYDTYDGHCFKPPADVDARIKATTAAGLPMMAIVFATPAWARGSRPCVPYNSWSDVFCIPDHSEDFARFAGYLAHHYDGASGNGRLTDFVIQNEVNLNQWFNVGCGAGVPCDLTTWVHDYAQIYNDAYDAIRTYQPHAKVMISLTQHFEKVLDRPDDTHPMYSIKTFLPLLVPELGAREWSVALHPYPRSVTPAIDARDLPYATMGNPGVVVGWLRATYPATPSAWNVEFTEQGLNNPGIYGDQQAASLCQAFRGVLGTPGVKSFIYHSLRDNLGEFGLYLGLLDVDSKPKPAWNTWLHANDVANPTCGFENANTTVIRTGVDALSGAHWTSSRPLPQGYTMQTRQWTLGYEAAPGTSEVFECGDGDDDASPPSYPNATWLSRAADCGGATPMGPVGWIPDTPGAGRTVIVTCLNVGIRVTRESTCATGTSTVIGYAPASDVPTSVLDQANSTTTTTTTLPVDVNHPDLSNYDVVFAVQQGTFHVGAAGTVALPDGNPPSEGQSYLVGTWDKTNGALALRLLVPSFTAPVATSILPDPIPTTFTLTQIGDGLGSLDPSTGNFRFDVSMNTQLTSPDPLYAGFLGPNCVLGPASITLRSNQPFDLQSVEPAATVADSGFAFPAASGCGDKGSLDQVLNPALELPTTDTAVTMQLAMIKGAPNAPTTGSTTVPTSTPTSLPTSTPLASSIPLPSEPRDTRSPSANRGCCLGQAAPASPRNATPRYTG